ncbi:MAG: hypothetical protein SFV51_09215 [Bryobacteraceae bacterium]|nr:hypothetical protein [Bryobacteraceae bacterium]
MFTRVLLVLMGAAVLLAQPPPRQRKQPSPRYDPAAEVTLKGTVEAVSEHAHPGIARRGVHITLQAAGGAYEVHLGPTAFLQKLALNLAKGDEIEVTGSKVKYEGADAVLARQVMKGGKTFELRNKDGIPLWSGGRRKNQD